MKRIVALLLFFFVFSNEAQIKVSYKGYLSRRTPECIDSVFSEYSEPKLDKKYFEGKYEFWNDIVYFCDVQTKTDRKIDIIHIYPINKSETYFSLDDPIWLAGENAIRKASKKWIFKEFLWDTNDIDFEGPIEVLEYYNKNKTILPFSGQTSYYLIIRICNLGLGGTNNVLSNIEVVNPKYKNR